jgi:hypothetical protein
MSIRLERAQFENSSLGMLADAILCTSEKNNNSHWGGRIRTSAWRYQKPLPYRLATPQNATLFHAARFNVIILSAPLIFLQDHFRIFPKI